MCVVDYFHFEYFVAAVHSMEALKVFCSDDGCTELHGTRLCDNEDEKRNPVSRSKV